MSFERDVHGAQTHGRAGGHEMRGRKSAGKNSSLEASVRLRANNPKLASLYTTLSRIRMKPADSNDKKIGSRVLLLPILDINLISH